MAGKLSPTAQQRVALLESFVPLVGRLNALVEQFATVKTDHANISASLKRTAQQLKMKFMGVGLDTLSQLCGAIELTAARTTHVQTKARTLRENVGSLKFQLELAIRTVIREDEEMLAHKKAEKATE
jgi:hypothetical protein